MYTKLTVDEIQRYITPLLANPDGTLRGEIAASAFFGHTDVSIQGIDNPKEVAFLTEVLENLGFHNTQRMETAGLNVLEFSNQEVFLAEENNEIEEDYDGEDEDDEDDEDEDEDDEEEETVYLKPDTVETSEVSTDIDIDGNMRPLRVLRDPEMKKLADKLYTSMLGNTDDYETYASFLYGFDTFLIAHKPSLVEDTRRNMQKSDDNNEEDDSSESASVKEENSLPNEFEIALAVAELRDIFFVEEARGKSARSQLLSALMKNLSGNVGDKVVKAWEEGDYETFGEIFGEVISKVMEEMPTPQSDEGDDAED